MAYKVVKKNVLNPQIFLMEVEAPLVAKQAEPGQFIILELMNTAKEFRLQSQILTEKREQLQLSYKS